MVEISEKLRVAAGIGDAVEEEKDFTAGDERPIHLVD
jgi:hypothetical protein